MSTVLRRREAVADGAAHPVWMEHSGNAPKHVGVAQQVGLALRAHRRELGKSQRAYAAQRGISNAQLAKMERDASGVTLGAVASALEGTGYCLVVLPVDAAPDVEWDPTDLEARTRSGSRFPANRVVKRSRFGPDWWVFHEMLGTGGCGAKPGWTAEP